MPRGQAILGTVRKSRVFPGFAVSETAYAAGTSLPRHSHAESILSFSVSGGTAVSLGSTTEWCDEAALLFLPAGEEHANAYPQPATRLQVEVTSRFWNTAVGRDSLSGGSLRHPLAAELRRAAEDAFPDADRLAEFALGMSLTDVAGMLSAKKKRARAMNPDHWLLRLRDFLVAGCCGALSMQALAEVAGHHLVHVSREFRGHFGKTITQFVRERRILRAAQLMHQDVLPIAEIALECGFYDQSHFTRAFQAYAGVTPSRYRASRSR